MVEETRIANNPIRVSTLTGLFSWVKNITDSSNSTKSNIVLRDDKNLESFYHLEGI